MNPSLTPKDQSVPSTRDLGKPAILLDLFGFLLPLVTFLGGNIIKPLQNHADIITISGAFAGFACALAGTLTGILARRKGSKKALTAIILGAIGVILTALWGLMVIAPLLYNPFLDICCGLENY